MKKIFVCLFLLWVGTSWVQAQFHIKSMGQEFLERIVSPSLFITSQSFQVSSKEDGKMYGFSGKQEFGVSYSVGVKVRDGIVLTDKAVRPWEYDANYDKYREGYAPVRYQSHYSEAQEEAKYDTLAYDTAKGMVLAENALYRYPTKTFGGKGLILDITEGQKEGWFVWVTSKKGQNLKENTQVDYTIYRKSITIGRERTDTVVDAPNTSQEVLGGIYVVPTVTDIGVMEFRLCGILTPAEKGWRVVFPFIGGGDKGNDNAPSDVTPIEEGQLTPVDSMPQQSKGKDKEREKDKKKKEKKEK